MSILSESPSAVAAIYSSSPLLSIILAHFLIHEPFEKKHIVAVILSVIGILFILNPGQLEMSVWGFFKAFLAALFFAFYSVLSKEKIIQFGSTTVTFLNMLFGSLHMFTLLLLGKITVIATLFKSIGLPFFADISLLNGLSVHSMGILLYVGIVVSGIGYLILGKVIEYTSATESSFILLLKPIFATLFSAVFLHETISCNRVVGIALFVAASLCVIVPELKRK